MLWRAGGKEGYIGNVSASQRLDALIDLIGTFVVAMETHVAEVGLYQTGFQVGYTYCRFCYVNAQSVSNHLDGSLGCTVHISSGIGGISGHAADVDDVTLVTLHHPWYDEACHGQEPLDIGVDHGVPVFRVTLVLLFQAECKTGIVDKYIDGLPFWLQRIYCQLGSCSISNIKHQRLDLRTLCFELRFDGF